MLSRRAISFECSWARRCISAQSDFAFATAGTPNASSTAAQNSQVDFISGPFERGHNGAGTVAERATAAGIAAAISASGRGANRDFGAGRGNRTPDQRFTKPLLYR